MQRLGDIRTRIGKVRELRDIVAAMRAIAAMRLRQAQDSMVAVEEYTAIVAAGLQSALALVPDARLHPFRDSDGPRLVVAFGAEHGFAGPHSDRIIDAAASELADGRTELAIVGSRTAALARERGLAHGWTMAAPVQQSAMDRSTRLLFERIQDAMAHRPLPRTGLLHVDLLYIPESRHRSLSVERLTLVPLSLERFAPAPGVPPLHHQPPEALLQRLVAEYMLAELARVFMESFAGENRARLQTMDQAHRNIEDRLGELFALSHRLRQEEITGEILDVATGATAVQDMD